MTPRNNSPMILQGKIIFFSIMYEPTTWLTLSMVALLNWTPNFDGAPTWLVSFAYAGFVALMIANKYEEWKKKKTTNSILKDVQKKFEEESITIEQLDKFLDKHN